MDADIVDKCNICMDSYDNQVRPRCLPCGHYYCTVCITNSISGGNLSCPHCQKSHHASNAYDFPIIFGIETLISEYRKSKVGVTPKMESESPHLPIQPGDKWKAVFDDEKESLRKLIIQCDELLSDLHDYQAFLSHRSGEYEEFITRLQEWLQYNEDVRRQIGDESKRLTDSVKEANELKKSATDILSQFSNVSSIKDIVSGSEEVRRSHEVLEEWRIRTQNHFANAKLIIRSEKIESETAAA